MQRLTPLGYLLIALLFGCDDDPAPLVPPDSGGRFVLPECSDALTDHAPLATRCTQFVDSAGRVVLLHGMNARVEGLFDVTFDDGRTALEEIPDFTAEDAARMREMGFNLLRLPVNWSGIEPTDESPPAYSEAYLARLEEVVDHCREAGILVLIDFHQDAYSKEIGEDGAPLWAIQPPPDMLLEGPLHDLGDRRASEQVLRAFNTFLGDEEPGPTLRKRFGQMVAAVASRFVGDQTVIGYEVFNEPVGGDERSYRLAYEIAEVIRAADPGHLIAFEPSSDYRVIFDDSRNPEEPFPVPGGVYAPHVYTLAFTGTTEQRMTFTRERLEKGNRTAYHEAVAFNTPLLVGEFGYDPRGIRAMEYLEMQLDLHDEFGASDAFWVWKESSQGSWGLFDHDPETGEWTERETLRRVLSRPAPQAIAGQPYFFKYDRETKVLDIAFRGERDVEAPSLVYIPAAEDYVSDYVVTCDDAEVETTRDPATGLIEVPCNGYGNRRIRVSPR